VTIQRRIAEARCWTWASFARAARRLADWTADRHTAAWRSMPPDPDRDRL